MEAQGRLARRFTSLLVLFAVVPVAASDGAAAGYRTTNFVIDARSPQLAKEIGDLAEHYRRSLALEWLGQELPPWSRPCPVKAIVGPGLGAGGATSFVFDRGEVFGWRMNIQGSRQRVLDSVLPHEITHTIFASHFRQPVPRWADEGACTTVEHQSEIAKQEGLLINFLKTQRGIPFSDMMYMKEYPQDVLPLYAQGHSLARYLIDQRGKRAFLSFLSDGMRDNDWPRAVREHYRYENLLSLQESWLGWVKAGRPPLPGADNVLLAANQPPASPVAPASSGVATAAMGSLAGSPQRAAVQTVGATAAGATAAAQPAMAEQSPASRSVYGEKTNWQPARRNPSAPTAASAPSAPRAAAYDAARPTGTLWR